MKKLIPFAVAAGLALGGCASGGGMSGGGAMHTEKDASAAIMAAEQKLKEAAAAYNEWRDTGKIIKAAQKANKAGKYDEAVKLADKAERQSVNALAQVEDQKNAGPR